ncbi:MAG: chemotaxis protein CheW [Gammaproteobacteria bacterium]|nr:chemotaxis protein CheW [Gammaproteobacteria bacterium]
MTEKSLFSRIQEIESLSKQHAAGLPTEVEEIDEWVGVGFRLGDFDCVAAMGQVTEILPQPSVIRVPGVKGWVLGLANIRGSLMPVLDLNGFIFAKNIKKSSRCRVLIMDQAGVQAALLVSEVLGLHRFDAQQDGHLDVSVDAALDPFLSGAVDAESVKWNVFSVAALSQSQSFMQVLA